MKILWRSILVLFLILFCLSCEKNNLNNDPLNLFGIWYNPDNYTEYFNFIDNNDVIISGHEFDYFIISDSMFFSYMGEFLILCLESSHKFSINHSEQTLSIEDINELCLVNGTPGVTEYQKNIQPNKFIGNWISEDLSDTILFVTNDRFERPRGNLNDWYTYSFSEDSLTIQYSGPDKILVATKQFEYHLRDDTLTIHFENGYYGIPKGTKKYTKEEYF